MIGFIIDEKLTEEKDVEPFSIIDYINDLVDKMEVKIPDDVTEH